MRMIIEVELVESTVVTIAEKVVGIPVFRTGNQDAIEWFGEDGNYYLDTYVKPLDFAEDTDNLSNLRDKYPEYFI